MSLLNTGHVQAALDTLGLDIPIRQYNKSTVTAPEAAACIGTELGSIVKSLCFLVNDQPVIVLAAGDQRVDNRKIAAYYGAGRKRVKMANADQTVAITGYAIGSVHPLGHRKQHRY
nr:hypothetical protein [Anaerolineae bacterium]